MRVDEILERNRDFVRTRPARPLPPVETIPRAIVACYDPRLDELVPACLGLRPGEAFVFRSAGALVQPGTATMRSLSMAVFMFGVREIVVLGHTSCRMAAFQVNEFIETFRKRGVHRGAFGHDDLRQWAGAIPDPRRGVQVSLSAIREAPFLPADVELAGFVLDDATGALELVPAPGPRAETAPELVEEHGGEAPAATSEPTPEAPAGAPAAQTTPLVEATVGFVRAIQKRADWRHELQRLRQDLGHHRHPGEKLRHLETFVRQAKGDTREFVQAFEQLRRAATGPHGRVDPEAIFRLIEGLVDRA